MTWFFKRKASAPSAAWAEILLSKDANRIERALIDAAPAPALTLDGVIAQLDDAEQAKVLAYWQRSRWAPSGETASGQELRRAFAGGPKWKSAGKGRGGKLPPLYPEN